MTTAASYPFIDNMWRDEVREAMRKLWANEKALKSLTIHYGVGDEQACAIGRCLARNSHLQYLSLHDNTVCDDGARGLGEGLRRNRSLRKLTLSANRIGDDGARGLADGLSENKGLDLLNLMGNAIGPAGLAALGEGLARSSRTLGRCDIVYGDTGILRVVAFLRNQPAKKDPAVLLAEVAAGQAPLVYALLQRGWTSGMKDQDGNTALHVVARAGHKHVCRVLLTAGPRVPETG